MQLLVFVTRSCVSWYGYLVFRFSSNIVVASYRAVQRVTVRLKRLELDLSYNCVFANTSFHCYSAFELWKLSDFFSLCLQQCIDCVLNLPLNHGQC